MEMLEAVKIQYLELGKCGWLGQQDLTFQKR